MTSSPRAARGFWPLRDIPVVLWLVAAIVVALAHPVMPAPRWLLIHLVLLGAVTHSILVWSRHFADALLHTPAQPGDRRLQSIRLFMLNAGVLAALAGVVTENWPVTVAGATAVGTAVVWHGASLVVGLRRALPSRFGATVHYYVASAALLPFGLVLGSLLARGQGNPTHEQVMVAHVSINVLGWMGVTAVGTLLTLWPTMLRTRVPAGAERAARDALPVLVGAVVVIAGTAVLGALPLVAVGLAGYLTGLALVGRPFVAAARVRPPTSYPTWSVLAGLLWLVGVLVFLIPAFATAPSWAVAGDRFTAVTPVLAAGFGAQLLLGALSYLVPVVLGGGPTPVRAANEVFARAGALRITLINSALLVGVLPVPPTVRALVSALALAGLTSFLPLMFLAMRASRRARGDRSPDAPATRAAPATTVPPRGLVMNHATIGLGAVVLAVAVGVALDTSALRGAAHASPADAGVTATGRTTRVAVSAEHMRFSPSTIQVPAGDRLIIEVTNTDPHSGVHDLMLDNGAHTDRLPHGASATLDVGVVGRNLEGWCTVLGHRQMGMVLHVTVTDAATTDAGQGHMDMHSGPGHSEDSAAADLDFMAKPARAFVARDATLAPAPGGRVHQVTLHVENVEQEVAPGVTQERWTYNGTAPGPFLHGRVGDVFDVTLFNDGDLAHSIDFHAGSVAPAYPMRTIEPGQSLVYRFRAERAGVWMYHCSTMPMSAHIANGMFGAIVIEPRDLPDVDRSYVLIQSELYLGAQGGTTDVDKVRAEQPDAVVFNGYANQYDARPLVANVGERIRIWVLDAGPNRSTAFHVVGGQFDTVWSEGSYLLRPRPGDEAGGAQALALAPSQGGFVEITFPEAGRYPFVSHVMVDAERGAHGVFDVTN